jgi:hypothetical protein
MSDTDHLKYPIGKFYYTSDDDATKLAEWIKTINDFPAKLESLLDSMSDDCLDTPYRSDGWTGRQVVHHLADSHSQALMRFKWALTEDRPTIKPYLEALYAQLPDYTLPVDAALQILRGVHLKWQYIMAQMESTDWAKGYNHPQSGKFFSLREATALYAWHCQHHLGHLKLCAAKN